MEQAKALEALEPFLALTKSATSPRAAADLVIRATSAPNTFLFTELLETEQIQALNSSPEFAPYLTLLQIFSYGTYESYINTPNLPAISDAQTKKLRLLSLISLATTRAPSYATLIKALGLETTRQLEDLVISAIYAGLIKAILDPERQVLQIDSVAALRDVAPGSVPGLLSSLQAWAARCDSTLADLEAQMEEIRSDARRRAAAETEQDARTTRLVEEELGGGRGARSAADEQPTTTMLPMGNSSVLRAQQQRFGKRGPGQMDATGDGEHEDEAMDLDEEDEPQDGKKRASRRKILG